MKKMILVSVLMMSVASMAQAQALICRVDQGKGFVVTKGVQTKIEKDGAVVEYSISPVTVNFNDGGPQENGVSISIQTKRGLSSNEYTRMTAPLGRRGVTFFTLGRGAITIDCRTK